MIVIKKLYTEPEYFEPITFDTGVNLIIGDKSDESDKTNSVGKSMCIEFINFCLLKGKTDSRVMKIPPNKFSPDTKIILDLKINKIDLSISRTVENPDTVLIKQGTEELFFETILKASKYFQSLLFVNETHQTNLPSFRELLAPLIRDERSEFKDLVRTFDTKKRVRPNFIPHLFLLGFDVSVYKNFQTIFKELDKQTKYLSKLKKEITEGGNLKLADARSKVNALQSEVTKMSNALEEFRSNDAFESVQEELINLESELSTLRTKQQALKYEINKIQALPKPESISKTEISIIYNQFKNGLGDLIEKSLSDLENFKAKIDNFRNNIVNRKLEQLNQELNQISSKVRDKDRKYSEILKSVDKGKEVLNNLKQGLSIYNKKSEELNKIRYHITAYDEAKKHKDSILKPQLNDVKLKITNQINENETIRKSFEETILNIHEMIMDNKDASFRINTKSSSISKDYVDFEMRIHDDGGHSVERTKIFIYDMALLFNGYTRKKHPKLLIHDNIFDVDQDTLVQSLNYLANQEDLYPNDFQYILTLSRDKIESEEREKLITLDILTHIKANFTKENRFLNFKYKEK